MASRALGDFILRVATISVFGILIDIDHIYGWRAWHSNPTMLVLYVLCGGVVVYSLGAGWHDPASEVVGVTRLFFGVFGALLLVLVWAWVQATRQFRIWVDWL